MWVFWNEQFYSNEQTSIRQLSETSKSGMLGICTEAAICRLHIPHNTPCLPPIILHKHCLFFSWGHCNTQEKLKTKVMKSFGRQTRCIMGDIQIANGQFWNWLEQGRVYGIQSLVCSWHHTSCNNSLRKKFYCFDPQHGCLAMWLQIKNT